jgi:hypothetical protein
MPMFKPSSYTLSLPSDGEHGDDVIGDVPNATRASKIPWIALIDFTLALDLTRVGLCFPTVAIVEITLSEMSRTIEAGRSGCRRGSELFEMRKEGVMIRDDDGP